MVNSFSRAARCAPRARVLRKYVCALSCVYDADELTSPADGRGVEQKVDRVTLPSRGVSAFRKLRLRLHDVQGDTPARVSTSLWARHIAAPSQSEGLQRNQGVSGATV